MGLEALTNAFWANLENPIEVIKHNHRLLGATLTFQLLMGHEVDVNFETLSASLPVDEDGEIADLAKHKMATRKCAVHFIDLVDQEKTRLSEGPAPSSAPASSTLAGFDKSPRAF